MQGRLSKHLIINHSSLMNHARCKRYPRYLTVVYRYRPGVSVDVAKSNVMINKVISSNQDT
jgi:hypothetical protein